MAPTSLGVSIGLGHGEGIDFYVHTRIGEDGKRNVGRCRTRRIKEGLPDYHTLGQRLRSRRPHIHRGELTDIAVTGPKFTQDGTNVNHRLSCLRSYVERVHRAALGVERYLAA